VYGELLLPPFAKAGSGDVSSVETSRVHASARTDSARMEMAGTLCRFMDRTIASGNVLPSIARRVSVLLRANDQGDEAGCQLTALDQSDVPPSFVATM
jgi:hypothetical protein